MQYNTSKVGRVQIRSYFSFQNFVTETNCANLLKFRYLDQICDTFLIKQHFLKLFKLLKLLTWLWYLKVRLFVGKNVRKTVYSEEKLMNLSLELYFRYLQFLTSHECNSSVGTFTFTVGILTDHQLVQYYINEPRPAWWSKTMTSPVFFDKFKTDLTLHYYTITIGPKKCELCKWFIQAR